MKLSTPMLLQWLGRSAVLAVVLAPTAAAAAPITFTDIARTPDAGISFRRARSATDAIYDAIKIKPFMSFAEMNASPFKPRGAPGVALLDYDGDDDLDIYITNGPGRANSLYQSQVAQTGETTYVDVGDAAGVGATSQDSTGVCFGDIDNDGDQDLLVLGRMEPSRLFENAGDGTFTDISESAGVALGIAGHTSCSMADVDGDGLLDIFVANSFDWARMEAIFSDLFSYSQPNELYLNQGGNTFDDASETSGIRDLFGVPAGDGTITWAGAFVDDDQDGDVDLWHADDHAAMPTKEFAGVDRGFMQIHRNDGSGQFANVTGQSGSVLVSSSWMGVAFGDLNCDGHLDFFATSTGDYLNPQFGLPIPNGVNSSRWHLGLGTPAGVFTTDFQLPGLTAVPFGWGTGMADYDNDGDTDIIYYGNMGAIAFVSADNPGVVLRNEGCSASFTWDREATASTADFVARQTVEGVALGDLNDDGFVDIVYASGQYVPETVPLVRAHWTWGGPFDDTARILPTFMQIGPMEYEWAGHAEEDGFAGVKLSSASNGNRWVKVKLLGTKDLTAGGRVNRDGIGAMVKFTPKNGKPVLSPVLGGSSYASQHALVQGFGLARANQGVVEVLWPGGVRNRLYGVRAGERVTLPEIPCDYAASWPSKNAYRACVDGALEDLVASATITEAEGERLRDSALRAYNGAH